MHICAFERVGLYIQQTFQYSEDIVRLRKTTLGDRLFQGVFWDHVDSTDSGWRFDSGITRWSLSAKLLHVETTRCHRFSQDGSLRTQSHCTSVCMPTVRRWDWERAAVPVIAPKCLRQHRSKLF